MSTDSQAQGPAGRTPQSKPLYEMFLAVPKRYDLVNRAITWGLDQGWRREAARLCLATQPTRVMDLCCGTGDLVCEIAKHAAPSTKVIGFDYSQPMLDLAQEKAHKMGLKVEFVRGDASAMPFEDASFDCVGISFAFRNLTYKNPLVREHLKEVARVLKPGGRFVIVESSQPTLAPIRAAYHLYLKAYVGPLGGTLSGNRSAYKYLARSAERFFTPAEIQSMLLEAGFSRVTYEPKLFGAVALHVAVR